MSRKIHHGPNGSYKTSGALNDDLLPAVKEGRTIVSNVRGLEDKNAIIDACNHSYSFIQRLLFTIFPSKGPVFDFDLIYLDTEDMHKSEENIEKMRSFFHWVPRGALIIIDEVDEIFDPQEFNIKKTNEYDFPDLIDVFGRVLKTSKEHSVLLGRPRTLKLAFSKHRHLNWDFITTCTDISNVHPMIIKGADTAFRHINLINTLGLAGKGKYREIAHNPKTQGRFTEAQSNVVKKIPKYLFKIYKSTSTGEVTDSIAGTSMWAGNRKLRYMVYLVIASFGWSSYSMITNNPIANIGKKENKEIKQDERNTANPNIQPDRRNGTAKAQVITNDNYIKTSLVVDKSSTNQSNSNLSVNPVGFQTNIKNVRLKLRQEAFFGLYPPLINFMGKPLKVSFYGLNDEIKFTSKDLKRLNLDEVFITRNEGFITDGENKILFKLSQKQNNNFLEKTVRSAQKSVNKTVDKVKDKVNIKEK